MRVLLDCRMADWTGVGRYTQGLAAALERRDDVELVQVVATGATPPVPAAVSRSAAGHPFSPHGARAFGRVVADVRPDVVHCPHFPTPSPMFHPIVVTVHDFIPLVVPGVMPSAARRFVYRTLLHRAIRKADALVTLSEFTAAATRDFDASSASRITVVPAASDDFSAGAIGALPSGLSGAGRYVLGFGNVRAHKQLDVLLRAWAAIEQALPADVVLALTGDAPAGFVEGVLGASAAPPRIVWTGRVGDDALRALFAHATAFVFPSSHEGFGLPPLEAMALGAPVICSDAASLPEVTGDAALLVQPGDVAGFADAIVRVVTDEALRRELVERGFARAAAFSWDRTAALTAGVYSSVATR